MHPCLTFRPLSSARNRLYRDSISCWLTASKGCGDTGHHDLSGQLAAMRVTAASVSTPLAE